MSAKITLSSAGAFLMDRTRSQRFRALSIAAPPMLTIDAMSPTCPSESVYSVGYQAQFASYRRDRFHVHSAGPFVA